MSADRLDGMMPTMRARGDGAARNRRLGALLAARWGLVAVVVMAVAGIGISIYLTSVHYVKAPLLCPAATKTSVINCGSVLSSRYSVVPFTGSAVTGLPVTVPGMLWFAVSGGLALFALVAAWRGRAEPTRLRALMALWTLAGVVFVLYLVWAEIVQVHHICEWCTVVHTLTLLTFFIALRRLQEGEPEPLDGVEPFAVAGRHGLRTTRQRQAAFHRPAPSVSRVVVTRAGGVRRVTSKAGARARGRR